MPADRRRALVGWVLVVTLAVGCASAPLARPQQVGDGYPEFGRDLLADYGCVSCHRVPGVRAPGDAWVGPPLDHWSRRSYIAGALVNSQDNLVRWIVDPQGVEPGTAMPDVGVTEEDARNIAAYLMTLD